VQHYRIVESLEQEESVELGMVVQTHAVAYPEAVVVVADDACLAFGAVAAAIRAHYLAFTAVKFLWSVF